MIGEANLIKIMRAADRDDPDDVALRKLMVSALRECRADFTELLHSSTPWVGTSPAVGSVPGTCRPHIGCSAFHRGVRRAQP
jgi:hypothetical protein